MPQIATIQLRDFCQLFEFEDRQVRFVLEQGFVPKGVEEHPNTGNRREFGPLHAFWLAILIHLRKNGLKTAAAAELAGITTEGLRFITQNLNWDPAFLPMKGWFKTDHEYFLDLGDMKIIRLLTSANPSVEGLHAFDWRPIKAKGQFQVNQNPIVILRLNIGRIAQTLSAVEGWTCPSAQSRGK